jgi:hypothetical protein
MLFASQEVPGETPEVGEDEVEGIGVLLPLRGTVALRFPRNLNGSLEGLCKGLGAEAGLTPGGKVGEDISGLIWLDDLG